VNTLA
jgi:hypothetical protein